MEVVPQALTITDRPAALAFASAKPRSIMFALMQEEASLQPLSRRLGLSLSLLHYHVGKLTRLGLVQVERSEARAGRAVSIYRAAAVSFLVPANLIDPSPADGLRAELEASLQREKTRSPPSAISYELAEDGSPRMRRISSEEGRTVGGEWWARLRLNHGQAAQLTEDVRHLLSRYHEESGDGLRECLVYFALART